MKLSGPALVCAATRQELEPLFAAVSAAALEGDTLWRLPGGHAAVTGVGTPLTLLRLGARVRALAPGFVVNVGIAGAYPGAGLEVGDVVFGTSEVFADLGMEVPGEERFRPLSAFPFADALHRQPLPLCVPQGIGERAGPPAVRLAAGATVNTCAGTQETGSLRRARWDAGFESMEGAACALVGVEHALPVVEIRAVSNVAGWRDMRPENVERAMRALGLFWREHRELFQ
jgi:futalosine hydrolase